MGTDKQSSGKIWGIAAIVGVIAFVILKLFTTYGFMPALLLAILIAVLVAILLGIGFSRDADDGQSEASSPALPTSQSIGATTSAPAPATDPAPAKPAAKKPAAKAKSGAAAKKTTKARAKTTKTPARAKPKKPRKKAAAKPTAAAKAKSTANDLMGDAGNAMVSEKKASAVTNRQPVAKDGKPPVLKAARAGGADDLKQIKGVGPALEKTLNELGFYHFDQVALWRKKEIEWVDARLRFKGRIVRDGWIKQCKSLAKGDNT